MQIFILNVRLIGNMPGQNRDLRGHLSYYRRYKILSALKLQQVHLCISLSFAILDPSQTALHILCNALWDGHQMADMKSQGLHVNFKFHITLKEIKLVMSQGYFGCAITWPPKFWAQEADFKRLKKEFFVYHSQTKML